MSTTQSTTVKVSDTLIPESPIKTESSVKAEVKKNMYTLYYREGMNPHPQNKNFPHQGDLQSAVARAKRHCELMGCRFIIVRPFMSDLDQDEQIRFGRNQDQ